MKKVIIRQIQLTNFKGVRSLTVDFTQNTSIYGRNASGKSTIFDAFTWLLFGKNAEGKKQFGIKTLDADGKVIEKIPHEVTALLNVDGNDVRLTRRMNEKWQKKRGEAEEEFKGHEEERLFNDVPMSVRDWNDKISAICEEDVFKMVTNPLYFTSQKWDAQREMLIRMAGDVTDEDILNVRPELKDLIGQLSGKTLDEYKREIGAKKKRIKGEVDTLPARIEERKLVTSTPYDFNLATARLHYKEQELAELQMSIEDGTINADKVIKLGGAVAKAREAVDNYYREYKMKKIGEASREQTIKNEIAGKKVLKQRLTQLNKQYQAELDDLNKQRDELLAEWKSIKERHMTINEDEFVCPLCHRPLEAEDIEKKKMEMADAFNKKKIADWEKNKERGQRVRGWMVEKMDAMSANDEQLKTLDEEIAKKEEELKGIPTMMSEDDIREAIMVDDEYNRLTQELEKARTDYDMAKETDKETSKEDKEKLETLKAEVESLRNQVAKQEMYAENEKRIKDLERQLLNANEELAQLEGIEFGIMQYTKTRISMLEQRINALFCIVKFKLFETQINGGEVEICTATVDGVPYADLNKAMQINAGLDIINAICESEGVSAPIFIDNAEAVNELLKTKSQTIRLVVSNDEKLKVINQ